MQWAYIETRSLVWMYGKALSPEENQTVGKVSREVVGCPFLEVFRTLLDKALSNLVWPCSRPCFEQEVGTTSLPT